MKLFVALCALLVVASASQLNEEWKAFKVRHNKVYHGVLNELHRKNVFSKNLNFINKHNAEADNGVHSFRVAVNRFADLTLREFNQLNNLRVPVRANETFVSSDDVVAPKSVDWRKKGAVTGVKDQGQCGSCWAFSAVGSLEGQYFLKSKKLVSLSEQELVDCTTEEGNQGCNGGLMDYAFTGIKRLGGIESEADYPYTAQDGDCQFDKSKVVTTVTGFKDIPSGDEKSLTNAIATVGPISVAIDASSSEFQFYSTGVFDYSDCSSTQLDHGVTAVGYGTDGGKDYYIVKNSWASSWGQDGYILMSRNKNNQCGIATAASYPLL